jgi:serine protease DegQ
MRSVWLIFSQAVTVCVAALFVVTTFKPVWLSRTGLMAPATAPTPTTPAVVSAPAPSAPEAPSPSLALESAGFSTAVKRAAPAVVSITASRGPTYNAQQDDPWYRFQPGDRGRTPKQRQPVGLGSGVIVSAEGHVLTNHHVIERADDIEVQLQDGRMASATLVGTDPESDLAVLQIKLADVPVMTLGQVAQLQVGDAVLAIGNPFGVGQTVTSGIVSALGRTRLGINTFENFIQTDAAINPGNSGGALVDGQGRLVGINTAIYSRSGGNLGIGFAIPADSAKQILDSLVRDGVVTRGWMGVEPRDLTPEIAATLKVPVQRGVVIAGVLNDGPADQAGLQPGDVVLRVGTRAVNNASELIHAIAALKPRESVSIDIQRGPRGLTVNVVVAQRQRSRL